MRYSTSKLNTTIFLRYLAQYPSGTDGYATSLHHTYRQIQKRPVKKTFLSKASWYYYRYYSYYYRYYSIC